MNHLPIDPGADSSRRAWMPCPDCKPVTTAHNAEAVTTARPIGDTSSRTKAPRLTAMPDLCPLWTVDTPQARRRERDVVATIPLGSHACDVVVSPDGDHVYATTAKSVKVIDRAHRVVANIPVDVDPKANDGERRRVANLRHRLQRFDIDYQRGGLHRENGRPRCKHGGGRQPR